MFLNSAANNNSVVSVESTSAPVTLNGTINGGGLIKHGPGSMTLAGVNTYSGQIGRDDRQRRDDREHRPSACGGGLPRAHRQRRR
ncbi:MAG: hypothetical protein EBR86_06660 [Planctomycetia bacterium]|nr:hypothetical protein [Planctomycetia bacterium]